MTSILVVKIFTVLLYSVVRQHLSLELLKDGLGWFELLMNVKFRPTKYSPRNQDYENDPLTDLNHYNYNYNYFDSKLNIYINE